MHTISAPIFTGPVWRQTRPRNSLLDVANTARFPGRYHRAVDPGMWYASMTERGAWAELFRHGEDHGISPFEVRRRVGRIRITGLAVLDLTNPEVRDRLDVAVEELISDDL